MLNSEESITHTMLSPMAKSHRDTQVKWLPMGIHSPSGITTLSLTASQYVFIYKNLSPYEQGKFLEFVSPNI